MQDEMGFAVTPPILQADEHWTLKNMRRKKTRRLKIIVPCISFTLVLVIILVESFIQRNFHKTISDSQKINLFNNFGFISNN